MGAVAKTMATVATRSPFFASRRLVIAGAGAIVALSAAAVGGVRLLLDDGPSLTTDTRSDTISTAEGRVSFLARYLEMRTAATDAAFHVVYRDNSHGLPGPSDWMIAAAVLVGASDGAAWLAGAQPATPEVAARAAKAGRAVVPAAWKVTSPGHLYARGGFTLVWHPEGVVEISGSTF